MEKFVFTTRIVCLGEESTRVKPVKRRLGFVPQSHKAAPTDSPLTAHSQSYMYTSMTSYTVLTASIGVGTGGSTAECSA